LIFNKKSPLLALLNSKRLEFSAKNGWQAKPFFFQLAECGQGRSNLLFSTDNGKSRMLYSENPCLISTD
jgi:hypothetical protein